MIEITTREQYDEAVKKGWQPLFQKVFHIEYELRKELQYEMFGYGHTPQENEKFYRYCWEHLPHYCEECMRPLPGYSAVYVSHILSRGAHPMIAHDPRNVNILCDKCHARYENGNRKSMRIYEKNQKIIEQLKHEYYE